MMISYAMIVAISLVVSGYASFLIRERKKKAKHMQMMSGIRPWLYWLTTAIWDGVCYLIPIVIFIAIFAIFSIKVRAKFEKFEVAKHFRNILIQLELYFPYFSS